MALASASEPRGDVLEDAERADDGAVDASQQECEQKQGGYDAEVQCQDCRQKLYAGEPPEPGVESPGEVKKQAGNKGEGHYRQSDSNFSEHKRD